MTHKDAIRALFRMVGLDVWPYDGRRVPAVRRADLLRDRCIDLVFDVGANDGRFSTELRQHGYSGRILCFEPLNSAFQQLREPEKIRAALSDWDGLTTLNIAGGNSEASSLMEMTNAHRAAAHETAYVGTEEVEVHRLDAYESEGPAYLKIDAQGSERQILDGAPCTLRHCVALELELSLVELYEGQTLAPELLGHVYDLGFRMTSIWRGFTNEKSGEMLQFNAIFARM